jgi:hypothetical protein
LDDDPVVDFQPVLGTLNTDELIVDLCNESDSEKAKIPPDPLPIVSEPVLRRVVPPVAVRKEPSALVSSKPIDPGEISDESESAEDFNLELAYSNHLLELFDPNDVHQRILIAELNRHVGNFEDCMDIINKLDDGERWKKYKTYFAGECDKKNTRVFIIHSRIPPR